jgi:hypothetical protein
MGVDIFQVAAYRNWRFSQEKLFATCAGELPYRGFVTMPVFSSIMLASSGAKG